MRTLITIIITLILALSLPQTSSAQGEGPVWTLLDSAPGLQLHESSFCYRIFAELNQGANIVFTGSVAPHPPKFHWDSLGVNAFASSNGSFYELPSNDATMPWRQLGATLSSGAKTENYDDYMRMLIIHNGVVTLSGFDPNWESYDNVIGGLPPEENGSTSGNSVIGLSENGILVHYKCDLPVPSIKDLITTEFNIPDTHQILLDSRTPSFLVTRVGEKDSTSSLPPQGVGYTFGGSNSSVAFGAGLLTSAPVDEHYLDALFGENYLTQQPTDIPNQVSEGEPMSESGTTSVLVTPGLKITFHDLQTGEPKASYELSSIINLFLFILVIILAFLLIKPGKNKGGSP